MIPGSTQHVILFLCTAAFAAWSCVAVSKMPRIFQNIMILLAAIISPAAIFFRYAMGMSFHPEELRLGTLAFQMLQVCNFNFILLPLMLVPKFKLARQYSFYFSMFAACTTLVALSPSWANLEWYSASVLSSWISHSFAVICPLWMFASGGLRPERKYILPVAGCVFSYFTLVYVISDALKNAGVMAENLNQSYVYHAKDVPVLEVFYDMIGIPYWHLMPAFGIMIVFFCLLAAPFARTVKLYGNGIRKSKKLHATVRCKLKVPCDDFVRKGYYLLGWSETPHGDVKYVPGEAIVMGTKSMKLYAIWAPKDAFRDPRDCTLKAVVEADDVED